MTTVVLSKCEIITARLPIRYIVDKLINAGAPIVVTRKSFVDVSDYKWGIDFKITGRITQYEEVYSDLDCLVFCF